MKAKIYYTKKYYARRCSKFSNKYHVPFEVALVLGMDKELYKRFNEAIEISSQKGDLGKLYNKVGINSLYIRQQKDALLNILGRDLYDELHIETMQQKNVNRLCYYLIQKLS